MNTASFQPRAQPVEPSLAILDRDGEIIAVNDAWDELAKENRTASAKVGVNYLEACSTAAGEVPNVGRILAGIRSVLDGSRSSFEMDYPCHGPSEERRFLLTVTSLHGRKGGVVVSHRDITERVVERETIEKALNELRVGDERFRAFAASASEILQTIVVDQNLIVHHGDVDGLMGFPMGEFPSTLDGWIELIHPDDRDRIKNEVDRVVATGAKTWQLEYRIPDADGAYRHWSDCGFVTEFNEDGTANVGIGSIRDVTKEVNAQRELQQSLDELATSEALLKTMFASIPDSIAVVDHTGKVIAVNDAWTKFAEENGARQSANVGVGADYLGVCSAAPSDDPYAAEACSGIRSVLKGSRQSFKIDYPCHGPSEERWFTMKVAPIDVAGGAVLIAHRDITERIQRQAKLEEALAEVEVLRNRLEAESVYLQQEVLTAQGFGQIVGESDTWMRVLEQVKLVAGSNSTVLLSGETGTGKEVIARAIHATGDRAEHPLIKVNCAALPSTLIESELFGHEKGAFTGADAAREGRFELADGGTIFLDEIGELSSELQAKLLRVLEGGEFERLGSSKTLRTDVRVIAATNRDLQVAARDGVFRFDLYYRLAVFPIDLPPLRDRRDDIPLLAAYFLCGHNDGPGRSIEGISESTMAALQAYDWPGNVRELKNVIERGVIVTSGDTLSIDRAALRPPRDRRATDRRKAGSSPTMPEVPDAWADAGGSLEEVERAHIAAVLGACDWKVKGPGNAAERLGLKESTLRSRMKRLGIQRPGG